MTFKLESIAIDPKKLTGGVWWDFETGRPCDGDAAHPSHFCVLIVHRGAAYWRCVEELRVPHLAEIRAGKLAPEIEHRIRGTALAKHVAMSFVNGTWQGKPIDNTEEGRIALLSDVRMDTVCLFLENAADNRSALLAREEEQAQGN